MDEKRLIETITAEIMKRLQGDGGSNDHTGGPIMGSGYRIPMDAKTLAQYIDHTMLKPDAPSSAYDQLCSEAIQYHFKSVCVNSSWVPYVAKRLQGTKVQVCSVVGFPLGAMTSRSKAFETREAIEMGADEIDMVLAIGKMKSGEYSYVEQDILAVRRATRSTTVLKVIIETSMLTQEEKVIACQIAKRAGADFVKTSTGFGGGGATVEDIALMRSVVGKEMGVKASGGVRDHDKAMAVIGAGATRIGAVSSVAIVTGKQGSGTY